MHHSPPPEPPKRCMRMEVDRRGLLFTTIHEAVAYLGLVNEELQKVVIGAPYFTLCRQEQLLITAAEIYGELLTHKDEARALYPKIFKEALYVQVIPRLRIMGYRPLKP